MYKFTTILFFTLYSFSYATIIDAIAVVVNGEPITTAEVKSIQESMKISKAKATELLIGDRLQKIAMKDIVITQTSLNEKISLIAQQNGITLEQMKGIIEQQGSSWEAYRKRVKDAIKKEKFFQTKIASTLPPPNEAELRSFYQNNQEKFTIPKTIHLIEYSAPTQKKIKAFLQTQNLKGIKRKKVSMESTSLEETLLKKFLQTTDGSFIQPLNAGDRYVTYQVLSKEGRAVMPFEGAKMAIVGLVGQSKQKKALKEYFQKLKISADIERLR